MASTRLLRLSKPLGFTHHETLVSSSDVSSRRPKTLMCLNISPAGAGERKPAPVKAAGCSSTYAVVSEPKTEKRMDLELLFRYVADAFSYWRKFVLQQRAWGLHIQMFLEKAIVDCRFFALLAIGGSLICSLLCFLEGCFLVTGSYFHALLRMSEQAQVVHQLIEAIDMFIMGTAMLVFAMALYVMFVGSPDSTVSKNFNLKKWMGRGSAMEAKAKIGHAVMLILQVQVLDKFRTIGVSSGMDLACFAGAIFLSSASIFILSRISDPAHLHKH
ncbi:uncharacterized protein LOC125193167 [Salvia hispanica]|uniref:uncharacterized protein LOC125193167 n=1 Tax=Salvia hispanica TaxID=49212 RepID=UPI0020098267|nr:uncharacterized protein LOC125193167 [Salvia hispanica]